MCIQDITQKCNSKFDTVTEKCDFLGSMIQSFTDKETEKVYHGIFSKKLPNDIQRRALNKLRVLNAISIIDELVNPPSNRLEALKGDRSGQYRIRINKQWRICFEWKDGHAHEVEITDYD